LNELFYRAAPDRREVHLFVLVEFPREHVDLHLQNSLVERDGDGSMDPVSEETAENQNYVRSVPEIGRD